MIYLLTTVGLSPDGSITVHIHTQTIHRTQITNLEECGPCPVFVSFTMAFSLQLREKNWKTSVRVQYTYYQNTHTLQTPHTHTHTHTHAPTHTPTPHTQTHTPTHYKTHTYTRTHTPPLTHAHTLQNPPTHTHPHTHTLQNNTKQPQYKLKQTQCKIYPNDIVTILSIPSV